MSDQTQAKKPMPDYERRLAQELCVQMGECAATYHIVLLLDEVDRLNALLNTPETEDFDKAIPLEAAHQIERWGVDNDSGKTPADWFWLVGYLAGKALAAHIAGNTEKAKHHCISTSAALRNWHAHIRSGATAMRPGIAPPLEIVK